MKGQPSAAPPPKMPCLLLLLLLLLLVVSVYSATPVELFPGCVSSMSGRAAQNNITRFYTPNASSFNELLDSRANNLRYRTPSTPLPDLIFTPGAYSDVQAAVRCAKNLTLPFRLRSGGHDYEAVSYVARHDSPFILIDFSRLRRIDVDLPSLTAVVQSGATIGEVYYRIAEKSSRLGFPAGLYTSLGVGGHITGGGYGGLMRKYGLAVDNVEDVRIVDSNGEILDREAMGEDRFWAIRGGGGGSFGAILDWTLKLVEVPDRVTVFTVTKTREQGLSRLLTQWQTVAPALDERLFIRVVMQQGNASAGGSAKTIAASFTALYLGSAVELLGVMGRGFPELGVAAADCQEMGWIESVVHSGGYPAGTPKEALLQGKYLFRNAYKAKSDFVRDIIPAAAMDGVWDRMMAEESAMMIWTPFGGKMEQIAETETAYPHRQGVKFMIQYVTTWMGGGEEEEEKHMEWIRELYDFMSSYVSSSPREAYLNYRDFDLGENRKSSASGDGGGDAWERSYYRNNIERLIQVKAVADPDNLFRHEQSIPLNSGNSRADGGAVGASVGEEN